MENLIRNQAGNSSVGYLLLVVGVGIAAVSSISLFGNASDLAIAGKVAPNAAPVLSSFSAAAEGDEVEMEIGIAPSELGENVAGGEGQPIGNIDPDGTIRMADGTSIGTIRNDGVIVANDGSELGLVGSDGVILAADGTTVGSIAPDGTILAPASEIAESSTANEAEAIVPGTQTAQNERTETKASSKKGPGLFSKLAASVGLIAGGVALIAAAPVAATVAGIAVAGVGLLGLYDTFFGKSDDEQVSNGVAEETMNGDLPPISENDLIVDPETGELMVDPETGLAFAFDPESGNIMLVDPTTMEPLVDPESGARVMLDPETGELVGGSAQPTNETVLDAPNAPGDRVDMNTLLAPYDALLSAPQMSQQTETYVFIDPSNPDSPQQFTMTTTGSQETGFEIVAATGPYGSEDMNVIFEETYSYDEFGSEASMTELEAVYAEAGLDFGTAEGGANVVAQQTSSTGFTEAADGSTQQLSLSYVMMPNEDGSDNEATMTIDVVETSAPDAQGKAEAQIKTWELSPTDDLTDDGQGFIYEVLNSSARSAEFTAEAA